MPGHRPTPGLYVCCLLIHFGCMFTWSAGVILRPVAISGPLGSRLLSISINTAHRTRGSLCDSRALGLYRGSSQACNVKLFKSCMTDTGWVVARSCPDLIEPLAYVLTLVYTEYNPPVRCRQSVRCIRNEYLRNPVQACYAAGMRQIVVAVVLGALLVCSTTQGRSLKQVCLENLGKYAI